MRDKERDAYLKNIILNLSEGPGCYQYLDENGNVIYVGKAKNLKRRVNSYFNKEQKSAKTRILVSKIWDIKYVVVASEQDALLLENNLIKKYKPRYNVQLKDDKTFPSICITKEDFPRIYKTRNIDRKNGTYFGPYSNVYALNTLMQLIHDIYPIRTCHFPINSETIKIGKNKVCLEYHIHNCMGPCMGKQTREEYNQNIDEIREILKGNIGDINRQLKNEMMLLANNLRFEEAQALKTKIEALENFKKKTEVVSNSLHNIDVFSIANDENAAFVNFLHITNGCINQAFTFEYKKRMDETKEDLIIMGILEMRERYKSKSKEIIIPFSIELELEGVTFTIPKRGDKKTLLDLSENNVKQYKLDRLKQMEKINPEQKAVRIMKELQEAMKLPSLPLRIECFDNSNINGTDPVAACVVFDKAKPNKKEYRTYNIKTVVGPDDYASMKEVVRRRYSRILKEQGQLPNLIITDGGKGQMEMVREVIEDELHMCIPIAGLAKDNKHKTNELLYGFPQSVIGLKSDSLAFKLLAQIQEEVHRFAITFHRKKRSKRQTASELDNIKGIGPKTKEILLTHFKSIERLKKAKEEEIIALIGQNKTRAILDLRKEIKE